jgi:hypothetical protein
MKTETLMKLVGMVVVFSIMFLGACTPPIKRQSTVGVPIEKAKVDLIVKNETTETEIQAMFGSPMNKVLLGDQEMWMYMYQSADSQTDITRELLKTGSEITVKGIYQKLDVYIKEGIVSNYLYNDAPMPTMQGVVQPR